VFYNFIKLSPHSYLKTVGNLTLTNWKVGPITKEQRFKRENPFYQATISPGPGGYNLQEQGSLRVSNSKIALEQTLRNKKGNYFGNTYDKYKNVYYSELSKDFQNREGPGPGYYMSENKPNKTNKKYSFPKGDRKLSNSPKNNSPSPTSYDYEKGEKKVKAVNNTVKFGTSKRDFDFSKCKFK
jgi:hypothetical protein